MRRSCTIVATAWVAYWAMPLAPAQAASSTAFVSPSSSVGGVGSAASPSWQIEAATVGTDAFAAAASPSFQVTVGFAATIDVATAGAPWVTAVRPMFTPLRGGAVHVVHGTELDLGGSPIVRVDGVGALLGAVRRDRVDFTMPSLSVPGWRPVLVSNVGGQTIATGAVGVLPMIDFAEPWGRTLPNRLVYRGRPNDSMVWALAHTSSPFPVTLPGYFYALHLELATLLVISSATVTSPDGLTHLDLPVLNIRQSFELQCLALSSDPGYAPGAFTNVLRTP
jgi:hypothetical protein